MRPQDKQAFLEALAGVHDFYGKELTEFSGQVWLQIAEQFELEQMTKAFSAHLVDPENGRFFPKPADLVRQLAGTQTDRALIAWGKVHRAMSEVGAYSSVAFDEPAIHAAIVDMGGWPVLCQSKVDELPFLQKRFCDTYRAYLTRGCEAAPSLPGLHDMTNAALGHSKREPERIGQTKRLEAPREVTA